MLIKRLYVLKAGKAKGHVGGRGRASVCELERYSVALMTITGVPVHLASMVRLQNGTPHPHPPKPKSQLSKLDHLISHPSITHKLFLISLSAVCERNRHLSKDQTRTFIRSVSSEIRARDWADKTTCPLIPYPTIYPMITTELW